jgi:hypothetical protein
LRYGPVWRAEDWFMAIGQMIDEPESGLVRNQVNQVIYCRDRLGIPDDRLNVDGGAISDIRTGCPELGSSDMRSSKGANVASSTWSPPWLAAGVPLQDPNTTLCLA